MVKLRKYDGENTKLQNVYGVFIIGYRLSFHHRTILVSLFRLFTIVISGFRCVDLYVCRHGSNGTPFITAYTVIFHALYFVISCVFVIGLAIINTSRNMDRFFRLNVTFK